MRPQITSDRRLAPYSRRRHVFSAVLAGVSGAVGSVLSGGWGLALQLLQVVGGLLVDRPAGRPEQHEDDRWHDGETNLISVRLEIHVSSDMGVKTRVRSVTSATFQNSANDKRARG